LSIRPQYSDAIFSGEKRFEFRRTTFKKKVDVVVVYSTSPIGLVVGEFDVKEIISDDVEGLWRRTKLSAGIDRRLFVDYFAGCSIGFAIAIGNVRRYARPRNLMTELGIRPPQSFAYL